MFPRAQRCRQVSLGLQIERHEKGNLVTSDGSDWLLLEIWLLEKISSTDIFFFWVEKYFAIVFIIVSFFFPPFLFFLGTILLVWTKQFHFTGPNPVLFFFHFFNIEIFDRRSWVPTSGSKAQSSRSSHVVGSVTYYHFFSPSISSGIFLLFSEQEQRYFVYPTATLEPRMLINFYLWPEWWQNQVVTRIQSTQQQLPCPSSVFHFAPLGPHYQLHSRLHNGAHLLHHQFHREISCLVCLQ